MMMQLARRSCHVHLFCVILARWTAGVVYVVVGAGPVGTTAARDVVSGAIPVGKTTGMGVVDGATDGRTAGGGAQTCAPICARDTLKLATSFGGKWILVRYFIGSTGGERGAEFCLITRLE